MTQSFQLLVGALGTRKLTSTQSFQLLVPLGLARTQSFQLSVPLGIASTQSFQLLVPLGIASTQVTQVTSARGTFGKCEDSVLSAINWYPRDPVLQNHWHSRVNDWVPIPDDWYWCCLRRHSALCTYGFITTCPQAAALLCRGAWRGEKNERRLPSGVM